MDTDRPAMPQASPSLQPVALIVAASALAHLWCLGSQFWMDDMTGIRDNVDLHEGRVFKGVMSSWTYLGYFIQYQLFGKSPVGFHAVNWLLHTAVACSLFAFAREAVTGPHARGTALFAALLFAVHPLCSEIPNYVRCQDLAWVTLFSMLASLALLRFLRDGKRLALLGFFACVAGATISKGPGFFHAAIAAGAVALVALDSGHRETLRRRAGWLVGTMLAGLAVLWWVGVLPRWFAYAGDVWETPRFIGHAYTLARVFWEFAWRTVIPLKLCADHQIAETMVPPDAGGFGIEDTSAMTAAVAMLALTLLGGFLMWRARTRLFGACLLVFTGTILFRMMYVIPEFMPEYRIYPGMPWLCLGAAILLGALWRKIPGDGSPKWLALIILVPCIVLSARRSFVWHDTDRLCADILRQYPAQGRAVWKLHDRDMDDENWRGIIERQNTMWPPVLESFISQTKELAPARDLNSGHFALADVACHGRFAIALAHEKGPAAGIAEIRRLEAKMRQLGIQEETNRTIWGYFHHARATVMELAGAYPEALESMRFEGVFKFKPADIQRLERKLADQPKPSP